MASAKSAAASEFKQQVAALQAKVEQLHALREGVLEELVSWRNETLERKCVVESEIILRSTDGGLIDVGMGGQTSEGLGRGAGARCWRGWRVPRRGMGCL